MSSLFGAATRAGLAQSRSHISSAHLFDAATEYRHLHDSVSVDLADDTLVLIDSTTGAPVSPRWSLAALATEMSRARVLPDQVGAAFTAWVEHRPPTPAEIAHHGRLVLDWASPARAHLTWVTAIERLHEVVIPMSHLLAGSADRTALRNQALANSRALTPHLTQMGAITLISATNPALSTGLLTRPDPFSEFTRRASRTDQRLVITPGAPIAQGTHSATSRLAQETNTDHVLLRWNDIPKP